MVGQHEAAVFPDQPASSTANTTNQHDSSYMACRDSFLLVACLQTTISRESLKYTRNTVGARRGHFCEAEEKTTLIDTGMQRHQNGARTRIVENSINPTRGCHRVLELCTILNYNFEERRARTAHIDPVQNLCQVLLLPYLLFGNRCHKPDWKTTRRLQNLIFS